MSESVATQAPAPPRFEYAVAYMGVGRGWAVLERRIGRRDWVFSARPFTSRESAQAHAETLAAEDGVLGELPVRS